MVSGKLILVVVAEVASAVNEAASVTIGVDIPDGLLLVVCGYTSVATLCVAVAG